MNLRMFEQHERLYCYPALVRILAAECAVLIDRDRERRLGPRLEGVHQDVRVLYGQVYGWDPPQVEVGERLSTTRIRQYVRRWINEWDLHRLYPDYDADDTVIEFLASDYSEHPALEAADESPESDADFER